MLSIDFITKAKKRVKAGNNFIGYLQGDQFIKPVYGSKHQLKCPPAWAIDAEVFDQEVKPCASEIVIFDRETGSRYIASVKNFDAKRKSIDRGFGRQYYLPLSYWKLERADSRQLNLLSWGDADVS
jgi:hypothetical protein